MSVRGAHKQCGLILYSAVHIDVIANALACAENTMNNVASATINRDPTRVCWDTKPSYKTMKLIDDYCKTNNIDFDISQQLPEE